MRFRLKNKSYVLNTKIKLVGKNGANLSIITSDINNPTSNYNLTANTITFCLSPLPAVIGDPEVIVNEYTTSGLDFENGLIDKIPTTIWIKEGTADITSVNKIFGQNSFETKALGDSLSTSSPIITGGGTPFTIEFYALIKSLEDTSTASYINIVTGDHIDFTTNGQGLYIHRDNKTLVYYRYMPDNLDVHSKLKISFNEINKITMSYDGACIRIFINDYLSNIIGTLSGFIKRDFIAFYKSSNNISRGQILGIIDNINIHDGIATKVRDYDPYEEFLIVDLAFDGENNSTKIVDNGSLKSNWTVNGNAKISTDQKFDGFSSLYLDGNGYLTHPSTPDFIFNNDFTIKLSVRINEDLTSVTGKQLFYSRESPYSSGIGLGYTGDAYTFNGDGKDHKRRLCMYDNTGMLFFLQTSTIIEQNKNYELTILRENGVLKLYLNNILEHTLPYIAPIDFSKLPRIGTEYTTNNKSNCYIKNFKIYKGVAVIPEDPTGKIQLDFDNNVTDKYGNSTWTNNGVTFDQVNSVKGHAAYFNNGSNVYLSNNGNLNFENKNFNIEFDGNKLNNNQTYSSWLTPRGASYPSQWCELSSWNSNLQRFQNLAASAPELTGAVLNLNTWYKWQLTRNSGTMILKANDVVTGTSNYTPSMNVNFSNGTGTNLIGVSSNAMNCYMDNFKSEKDYKGNIVIDKPAVHLPLETNAINTGFTPLTINSVGNPTYTTIDNRKCIKFESGKYLTINSSNIFNLGTNSDFYMEADIYVLSNNSTQGIISATHTSAGANNAILYINSNGKIYFRTGNNTNPLYTVSSNIINTNEWQNIKLFRKNDVLTIELNGIQTSSSDIHNIDFSLSSTVIGLYTTVSSYFLNGYMSNFKMFVGTSEIPETYNDKAILDLDFKPTGKSYLFKDNNNKCVIHPVNITQRDYQNSQYCCSFNGTNQYLQLGKNDLLNFGNDDFIIEFKFKPVNTSNWNVLIANGNTTSGDAAYCYIGVSPSNHGTPNQMYVNINSGAMLITYPQQIDTNSINTVIFYKEGNTYTLVVNGQAVSNTVATIPSFDLNNNNNTIIGRTNHNSGSNNHWFTGEMYSVKIFRNTSNL